METEKSQKDPRVMWVAISLVLLLIIVSLSAILLGDDEESGSGNDGIESLQNDNNTASPSSTYHLHKISCQQNSQIYR